MVNLCCYSQLSGNEWRHPAIQVAPVNQAMPFQVGTGAFRMAIFLDRQRLFREKTSHEKIQTPCLRDQTPPPGHAAALRGLPPGGEMPRVSHLASNPQERVSGFCA